MTEVSVVHTAGTEETAEPSEVMDSSAVEPTENDMKFDQPDTAAVAESELMEESAEPVILSVCCNTVFLPPPRRLCFCCCLSVATLRKNFGTDLPEIFGKVGSEQMIKFWWQSGSPSGYRDCFLDLSLLGDMESHRHKPVAHTDPPDGGTGKMCLG